MSKKSDEEDYLFFPAPEAANKYKKLLWSGQLFLWLGVAIMASLFLYNLVTGEYDSDSTSFKQILPFILFFIPAYGLALIGQALGEKKMYLKAAMNGMLIDSEKISGPLALLEGPVRNYLRDIKKVPIFKIPHVKIENFIVEPSRGKKGQAPPYYKITIQGLDDGMATSYFILRHYFYGQEKQIVEAVSERIGKDRIIYNDELRDNHEE